MVEFNDRRPPQKVYRGLHLGAPGKFDPNDDASVLGAVRRQPSRGDDALYGRSWTTDRGVAHRFAHDPRHDQPYKTYGLSHPLPSSDTPDYAVVLEAHVRHAPGSAGTLAHEREVAPPRRPEDIESVTAHLHTISKTPKERRKLTGWDRSYVRSIPVPPEHWKG